MEYLSSKDEEKMKADENNCETQTNIEKQDDKEIVKRAFFAFLMTVRMK